MKASAGLMNEIRTENFIAKQGATCILKSLEGATNHRKLKTIGVTRLWAMIIFFIILLLQQNKGYRLPNFHLESLANKFL